MTGSRARLTSLVLLVAGGLGGLVASAQPWWRLVGTSADAPVDATITGSTASAGLSQVLPACVLVAALLTLVLRSPLGRRILAVLAALLGLGTAVLGGWRPRPDAATIQQVLRQSSLADHAAVVATPWPWVHLGAGVIALAGAVVILASAPTWPRRADRYAVGAAADQAAAEVAADPDTWWKAMDSGVDPTAAEPRDDPPAEAGVRADVAPDPISDQATPSATMAADHGPHDEQHRQSGSGSDR